MILTPLKALRKNRLKTLLIYLSMTVAICAIFVITAISNGLISMFSEIVQADGDIIVTQKGIADTFFSNVDRALISRISDIPRVSRVQAVIVGASPIEEIPIAGIYGASQNRMDHYKLTAGTHPGPGDVILGSTIAKILDHPSEVWISNLTFRVSGIYHSGIGFEDGGAVLTLNDAGDLFHKSASFFLVTIAPGIDAQAIVKQINALDEGIEAKLTSDFIAHYNQFKILRTSAGAISAVAFFMGLLGIINMMVMVANDRRAEFGILRAIGISKRQIAWMLIFEALAITTLSFVTAVVLSQLLLDLLSQVEKFQGYVGGKITSGMMLQVFLAAVAMAVLGSLLPAVRAARTDPMTLIQRGA